MIPAAFSPPGEGVEAVVQAVVRVGGVALGPRSHGRITVERALASEARGPVHEPTDETTGPLDQLNRLLCALLLERAAEQPLVWAPKLV